MKENSVIQTVEEVYDITEEGTTKPLRVRLSNNEIAVVKYPNNSCGNQILVNELISSMVAEIIGLKTPPFGICHLSEDLILDLNPDWGLDSDNSGLCFYTKYISSSIPITFGTLMAMEIKDFDLERLILFDHIICNRERHAGNMILGVGQINQLYAIDHGTIFTKGVRYNKESLLNEVSDECIFDMSILQTNHKMYDCLQSRFNCTNAGLLEQCDEILNKLSRDDFKNIESKIPNEWINCVESDTITKLIEAMSCRVDNLKKITQLIIHERSIN